jgi:hypothetical protein
MSKPLEARARRTRAEGRSLWVLGGGLALKLSQVGVHVILVEIRQRGLALDDAFEETDVRAEVALVELFGLGAHRIRDKETLDDLSEWRVTTQLGPPNYSWGKGACHSDSHSGARERPALILPLSRPRRPATRASATEKPAKAKPGLPESSPLTRLHLWPLAEVLLQLGR